MELGRSYCARGWRGIGAQRPERDVLALNEIKCHSCA